MRFIDIKISYEGFRFMHKHSVSREEYSKGNPLYVVQYRHKNGTLSQAVIKIPDLATLVSFCTFKSYDDKKYLEYLINSLRGIPQESDTCIRWGL